jgi:hypothetical protein
MTKRTINFGDDVCHYIDIAHSSNIEYVKPCEEGKECTDLRDSYSGYYIYTCQSYEETYDNKDQSCEVDISCTTGYSCDSGKCKTDTCAEGQVLDSTYKCVNEPEYCEDYSTTPNKIYYALGIKKCVEIQLKSDNNNKNYYEEKVKFNTIASIADGQYIKDDDDDNILFCKNGYALYFYGGNKLKNPKSGEANDYTENMFLRCVTLLGMDKHGIIKYKIENEEGEKYYDPDDLPSRYSLKYYDKYLMTRYEIFNNYKKRLESITDCKEFHCEDDELNKWYYFYHHPKEYILYQNEPQVMEYLVQRSYSKYKAKYTSPYESSNLLNIKYLSLLSLLLLF